MRNFWFVAKHEYRKMAGKRSFVVGTLGIPMLIVAILIIGIIVVVSGEDDRPMGYVDRAGVLQTAVLPADPEAADMIEIRPYADETAAQAALENEEIQAYYVLPENYLQTREVVLFFWEDEPDWSVRDDFRWFIRSSLATELPDDVQQRLIEGPELIVRSMDGSRELDSNNIMGFFLPFGAAFLFVFIVMGSSGYLLQVVTDEKENRTMEIMITSVSPNQLISGKAFGLMAVALTQVALWLVVMAIALWIGSFFFPQLTDIRMPWSLVLLIALFFLPAYGLVAGLMTAIGSSVTELQQGQQISGIINLLFVVPFFFVPLFMARPDSPVLVFLTMFPTTSFITVTLRWAVSVVPLWQVGLSWLILAGTAVVTVFISARVFRIGMLRYGQSLNLKGMWQAVRTRS